MEPVTLLTLDELTERVGMSVRNVRFYTSKGLVPPPMRRGPVRLLHRRPRRPAGAGAGAAGPRLHALGDREVRRRDPRRRHARGHRAAPHHARAVGGGLPVEMSRAELERRAGRDLDRRRARHAGGTRRRAPAASAAGTRCRSPSSRSASACSTSASRSRRRSPRPTCTPRHGRAIAKELYELFRTMVWPVYKRAGRLARDGPRGRRAAQAAVDRRPWCRRTRPGWTRPDARTSPSAAGDECR